MYEIGTRVKYIGGAPGYDDARAWKQSCVPNTGDLGTVTGYTSPEDSLDGVTSYIIVRLDSQLRPVNRLNEGGWRMLLEWLESIEEE